MNGDIYRRAFAANIVAKVHGRKNGMKLRGGNIKNEADNRSSAHERDLFQGL